MIATVTSKTFACWCPAPTRSLRLRWWLYMMLVISALFSPWVHAVLVTPLSMTSSSRENPIAAGTAVVLIARVQGPTGSPLPGGTVSFFSPLLGGGVPFCTGNLSTGSIGNNTSEASCLFPQTAPVGTHNVTAIYNGNAFYRGDAADTLVLDVVRSWTVSTAITPTGGGSASPTIRTFVKEGFGVQFTFTPNAGYRVVDVIDTVGCGRGVARPFGAPWIYDSGRVTANCTVTGVFSNTFNVTFSAGAGGTVSPSGTQSRLTGTSPSLTATPNPGFRLTNVTGCGVVFNGGPAITGPTVWTIASITGDCTVTAFFTALPTFTVTAAAGAGGSISPASVAVAQGLHTMFTVTPASSFQIASITGCSGTRSGSTYTTGPITAACAVTATFSASIAPPVATTTRMIEFIFPALDYYFLTSRANEIALLDSLPAFARTGQSFSVFVNRVVGTQPITRFYFNKVALSGARDGHFYTLVDSEISLLLGLNPGNIAAPKLPVSEGVDSFAFPPAIEGVGGTCPSGLIPVFRVFRGNVRFPDDPNHRFTTSTAIYNEFVAKGWNGEGVKFCVPG